MSLALHNTLTRTKEPFQPLDPDHVRLYVCGPTVYQRIHIGNARPLIVFDVLFRLLRHLYPEVTYVRNITDVDDKIIAQAKGNGEPIEALTRRTTEAFEADAAALGCLKPTLEPKATEHIREMVALIERLIETGHAYAAEGHVLFHTPSMATYGSLSGRNRDDQIAGARVEVAPYKRDPADFILWKPAAQDEPGWDSPWGRGRPGWHIECSAMAEKHLGLPFDIHGGGQDLIFPHHENEIAQTCCAHGLDTMARYWLHNGFVDMRGQKMSKSLGNVLRLDVALLRFGGGEEIRYWMLGTHYRQPIDYSPSEEQKAKKILDRFYQAASYASDFSVQPKPDGEFLEALCDDINTPLAISILHRFRFRIRKASSDEEKTMWADKLLSSARFIGLLESDVRLQRERDHRVGLVSYLFEQIDSKENDRIEALINERAVARQTKNFARADAIRYQLAAEGVILEDGPGGTTWRRS